MTSRFRAFARVMFRVILTTAIALAVIAGLLYGMLRMGRPAARRASGGNDFYPIYNACLAYGREHHNYFPPLDPEPGRLMIDRNLAHTDLELTGEHVTADFDETVPVDLDAYHDSAELRADPNLIDDHSWWYLGYYVTNAEEGRAFVLGYITAALTNAPFGDILPLPEQSALSPVTRLKVHSEFLQYVQRLEKAARTRDPLWDDPAPAGLGSNIPFLIERPGHYPPYTGGWVCYLDRHAEYIDYPGKWPMTEEFIEGLKAIDAIGAILNAER